MMLSRFLETKLKMESLFFHSLNFHSPKFHSLNFHSLNFHFPLANELSCRLKEIERQQAALAEEHQRTQTELERVKNEPVCVLKEINILEGEFDYVCNKHEELFRHRPGRYVFVEKAEKRRRPPPKDTDLVAIPTEVLSPILRPSEPRVPMLPLETEPSTPKKTNPKKKLPDLRPVPLDLNRDDF